MGKNQFDKKRANELRLIKKLVYGEKCLNCMAGKHKKCTKGDCNCDLCFGQ